MIMTDACGSRFLSPDSAVPIHHSRTRSFKSRPRPRETDEEYDRPRRNSMPSRAKHHLSSSFNDLLENTENDQPSLRRVRSFKTTSKGGLVNRGDSFKKKRSKDRAAIASGTVHDDGSPESNVIEPSQPNPTITTDVFRTTSVESSFYKVVVLGPMGVGKTALTEQFMTSEFIGPSDNGSIDREEERTISVLLDGEESTLVFIDPPVDNIDFDETQVDAFLVVFASNDRKSFDAAVEILSQLRNEIATDRSIILVANKIDLVRKRQITADEARSAASKYDSKYAETSAALNHHVDELLVGILSQIRLKINQDLDDMPETCKKSKERKGSFKVARGILNRLFRKGSKKDKSCDNLYQL